jgi:hypothetical protein
MESQYGFRNLFIHDNQRSLSWLSTHGLSYLRAELAEETCEWMGGFVWPDAQEGVLDMRLACLWFGYQL